MIIDSYCGSFPHSLLSTSKKNGVGHCPWALVGRCLQGGLWQVRVLLQGIVAPPKTNLNLCQWEKHKYFWLVVWSIWIIFRTIGNDHPTWRTQIFQRGWLKPPTSKDFFTQGFSPMVIPFRTPLNPLAKLFRSWQGPRWTPRTLAISRLVPCPAGSGWVKRLEDSLKPRKRGVNIYNMYIPQKLD